VNIDYVNHAYSQLLGLYSDEEYDEIRTSPVIVESVDDDSPLPAPAGAGRPSCVECKEPNLSLRGDKCITCRISVR
jgi:hypothetical protein